MLTRCLFRSLARRSSGCGDAACPLCQYNPSRICKRNLKQKYLIDDHLRAKCGAGLRIEVVDETGQCVNDAMPELQLEVRRWGQLFVVFSFLIWEVFAAGRSCV